MTVNVTFSMWTSQFEKVDLRIVKGTVAGGDQPLSFGQVLDLWQNNKAFRGFFTDLLLSAPFDAYCWENRPVTSQTLGQTFEFALVAEPALANLQADPSPFNTHFASHPAEEVLTFSNLGGDAMLVVPAPKAAMEAYAHLAQFLKYAPREQVDAFWRVTGATMVGRVSAKPIWSSTAGLGVSWLHLRLDSRPKYYRHEPYRMGN